MEVNDLYYVYGLCTMFYAMMTYFFVRKGNRLSRLVALLMFTLGVQCLSIKFFTLKESYINNYWWNVQSSFDMIAVPMYMFILMELVRPGKLTIKNALSYMMPFIILPILYITTESTMIYYILIGWTAVLGNYFMIWILIQIPRYHRMLKENFSYTENINLHWLRTILFSFYIILGLWILNCVAIHVNVEIIYLLVSMIIWMTICYYLYKHEQVLDELKSEPTAEAIAPEERTPSELGGKIELLFHEKELFLNPQLKLSDVARAVGTNRTYVSNYFNQELGVSFYEYVNAMRIDFACRLLSQTTESIKEIACKSGFNSQQSFIRTFMKLKGVNPTKFRNTL